MAHFVDADYSGCDPVGRNPFGGQIFAMRPDGSALRQLTNVRGMTTDPDGTIHVELLGPFAYPTGVASTAVPAG